LDGLLQPYREQVQAFHETEQWRDKLIAGDEALLNELVGLFNADRQHLRQLVRNAQKEQAQNKPPRSARILFQYLMELKNKDQSADEHR
ncbi:MAG TPA: ribosome biogenesis factor YjgA, partial [Gammaproteobacteria bacterium]